MLAADPLLKNLPPGGRPQDVDAAKAVLGAALLKPAVFDELRLRISAEDFYSAFHQTVWRAMDEMHRDGRTVDVLTLRTWLIAKGLEDPTEALTECVDKAWLATNAAAYADTVQQTADLRRLIEAAAGVMRWAYGADPSVTPADVQREADRIVRAVLPDRAVSGAPVGSFAEHVVARAESGERPVTWATGFRDLDERLGGGLTPGTMTLLAARPSMGKTALLTRICRNTAWEATPVSLFSLEVKGESVTRNMLSAEVGLHHRAIMAGALTEQEWGRVRRARDDFRALPLQIHEGQRWRFGDLVAAIRHDVRRLGSRVVAIDYVQLIEPDERGRSRAEDVADISRELKLLALDLGVAMLAAAQLSREVEKRRDKWPTMADLRESGALEQDADVVMLLHRPEYYEPEKDDLKGLAHVDVVKQRDGPPGVVDLRWDGSCMKFTDVPEPEPAWKRAAREAREAQAAGGDA